MADAVEDLIEDWKKCKRNPTYISNGGGILRRFAAAHPDKKIDQIKPRAVHDWINGLNDVDLKTPKARISKLFSHAVLNEWVDTNFVTALRFERKTQTSVEVPTFSEIRSVIEAILPSAKYRPLIRPYSRRLYGGIRATEETNPRVRREGRRLLVPAGAAAKKGPARRLAVTPAFLAWDRWCDEQQIPQLARRELMDLHAAFRKEKGLQGVKKWLNWQRHCYASYRLPLLGDDLTALAEEMGNSPRVLLDNYVGNVTPADVKLFWAYRPPKKNS